MEHAKRKYIRLAGYDYSQEGGYFVTVCTYEHRYILSNIIPGTERERARVVLSEFGRIVKDVLRELLGGYGFVLDAYVIMPNHIHMIVFKTENTAATVGQFIGAIKSSASTRWYQVCNQRGISAGKLWQRNYYDHILRNEADYLEKRKYIEENPDKWRQDELCEK